MTASATGIIILAAGSSSRLGLPKQLLEFNGRSLLRHAGDVAIGARSAEVLAVIGFESDRMKHELDDLPVRILKNDRWEEGIASSIRLGLTSLPKETQAAVLMLCDQPFVNSELLVRLISSCTPAKPIAAAGYGGTSGVPACFDHAIFPELLKLQGDSGAKSIIRHDPSRTATLPFPDAAIDIDTMFDFKKHLTPGP